MAEATTETGQALTATSYAILGLLTHAPEISGYDLSKFIARSIGFFWAPARSQVYSELRRLATAGYANERRVAQTDRPDKRLFAITPAGLRALRAWVRDAPVELEPIKSSFLLKVFFGDQVEPEVLSEHIREYRRRMQELLDELRGVEAEIPPGYGSSSILTLDYGISWATATIAWCDEALQKLSKKRVSKRRGEEA